jgi:hypothetical protein
MDFSVQTAIHERYRGSAFFKQGHSIDLPDPLLASLCYTPLVSDRRKIEASGRGERVNVVEQWGMGAGNWDRAIC